MALNNLPLTQLVKTDEFDCYLQKFETKFKFDQRGKNSFFCCSPPGKIFFFRKQSRGHDIVLIDALELRESRT